MLSLSTSWRGEYDCATISSRFIAMVLYSPTTTTIKSSPLAAKSCKYVPKYISKMSSFYNQHTFNLIQYIKYTCKVIENYGHIFSFLHTKLHTANCYHYTTICVLVNLIFWFAYQTLEQGCDSVYFNYLPAWKNAKIIQKWGKNPEKNPQPSQPSTAFHQLPFLTLNPPPSIFRRHSMPNRHVKDRLRYRSVALYSVLEP